MLGVESGLVFALTATALLTSCSSSGEKLHLETQLESKIDSFHAEMNEGRFGDICAAADESLCGGEGREAFLRKLAEVRGKTGAFSGKASVVLDRGLRRKVRNAFFSSETITHEQRTECDAGRAVEMFRWSVHDGKAALAGYELKQILERGKNYVIRPGD